jgi:Rad3-related DNA helicase
MKYIKENTIGKPLSTIFTPYQGIVNNGCIIETQSEDLLWQLSQDEIKREEEPIDWHLFKEGEAVLIDNHGRKFACTHQRQGYVCLTEMKYDLIIFARNDDGIKLEFVFPTEKDFIRSINEDSD